MSEDYELEPRTATAASLGARPKYVVGIGASAGGLQALELLFAHIPADTDMAFVVVQHLSPDFKSLMSELLGRHTTMQVAQARDREPVQPNTIYLIPPKKDMIVSGGRLLLDDASADKGLFMPVDQFLRSLAEEYGDRSIGVVLSGTGSDGTRGAHAIHQAGGMVIAQSESSAQFPGMPRSVIASGTPDHVLPPEDIAALLARLAEGTDTMPSEPAPLPAAPSVSDRLFTVLRERFGVDFHFYKSSTVLRRIDRRRTIGHFETLEDYLDFLNQDPKQVDLLFKDLLIGVTRFFRDPEAFDKIEREIVPALVAEMSDAEPIRIWVAGCASGEEAYSLAMLFHEQARAAGKPLNLKIFATDVHRDSLMRASGGIYTRDEVANVSPIRLARYFQEIDGEFQIAADLRRLIVFSRHDLLKDPPFTRLHLITCRNLMIYLEQPAQRKVLSLFHFALRKDGVLFLGPSETISGLEDEFDTIDRRWRLYRKQRDGRLTVPNLLPLTPGDDTSRNTASLYGAKDINPAQERALTRIYDRMLERYMPPTLLLSAFGELVHIIGDASSYLRLPPGRSTLHISNMVSHDLKMALTTAMQRAVRESEPITLRGVAAAREGQDVRVDVHVEPIVDRQSGTSFISVSFGEPATISGGGVVEQFELGESSRERINDLELELRYTKQHLQSAIEQLETSNEELQATNEELMAANEELQSTNEELHSVNEELYTVNAEYERQIEKLTELTDDMDNLLRSTELGVIFVDRELTVRRFTTAIGQAFRLVPHDVGRPITHFRQELHLDDLPAILRRVIDTTEPFEQETTDQAGKRLLVRITPYRRGDSSVDGAVLTCIDVTRVREAEDRVRALFDVAQRARGRERARMFALLKDVPLAMALLEGGDLLVVASNDAFDADWGPRALADKPLTQLIPALNGSALAQSIEAARADGAAKQVRDIALPSTDGASGERRFDVHLMPYRDDVGNVDGIMLIAVPLPS
ncbi:MAG: chemotaxis protein CheB [Geminicoccaceae bacterium]